MSNMLHNQSCQMHFSMSIHFTCCGKNDFAKIGGIAVPRGSRYQKHQEKAPRLGVDATQLLYTYNFTNYATQNRDAMNSAIITLTH
jgi:hypothetical protein